MSMLSFLYSHMPLKVLNNLVFCISLKLLLINEYISLLKSGHYEIVDKYKFKIITFKALSFKVYLE